MKLSGSIVVLQIAILAATMAFADEDVEANRLKMSKESAYYTFQEKVGRVTLVVSGQLAGLEEARKYVPFQIAVGVEGKGPELEISRYNFELHDAYGQVHETVSAEDVQKDGINQFVKEWIKANPLAWSSRISIR